MPRRGTPRGRGGRGPTAAPGASSGGHPRRGPPAPWFDGSTANASSTSLPRGGGRGLSTLADEARNTVQRRRGGFGQDPKLRHKPVAFVSAGFMNPLKELEKDLEAQREELDQMEQEPEVLLQRIVPKPTDAGVLLKGAPVVDALIKDAPIEDAPVENTSVDGLVFISSTNAAADIPVPTASKDARGLSPSGLFVLDTKGHKSLRAAKQPSVAIPEKQESGHATDSSEEIILFKGRDTRRHKSQSNPAAANTPKANEDSMKLHKMDIQIRAVEKTIQNDKTFQSDELVHQEIKLKLQTGTVLTDVTNTKPTQTGHASRRRCRNTESDEEAALIADYIANMDKEDDEEDDESEAHPGLCSHAFHMFRELGGTDSDAVPETNTEDEDEVSDEELRRVEMGDERMAQMLAKQEELGLGADEILLYGGADSDDGQGDWQIAPKSNLRLKKASSKMVKIIEKKGQFPSATQMADAFDDLDLMDWHRPALNNFKRASKVPHVSDSELEDVMQMAFQKDRLKKAEKKRQREALRAQGLLGKNVNPDDVRIKYPAGMRNDDLEFELVEFLLGDAEQLILPPLDKAARKNIHMTASKLGIKTQSSGKGNSRYPVLYRTKGTLRYDEQTFTAATSRLFKQTYFTRVDVDSELVSEYKARASKQPSRIKRGANAISYRDGEIVGQHAAELGTENKGRLLLEKMGWSKGMSLGTDDNQGILIPVMQTIKKTKAGLGDI